LALFYPEAAHVQHFLFPDTMYMKPSLLYGIYNFYFISQYFMLLDVADWSMIAASTSIKPIFLVPFERDRDFIGREDILSQVEGQLQTRHRVSLYGLGGIGYWIFHQQFLRVY
jgi:hypothetical protein